jgi:hypothetical protein
MRDELREIEGVGGPDRSQRHAAIRTSGRLCGISPYKRVCGVCAGTSVCGRVCGRAGVRSRVRRRGASSPRVGPVRDRDAGTRSAPIRFPPARLQLAVDVHKAPGVGSGTAAEPYNPDIAPRPPTSRPGRAPPYHCSAHTHTHTLHQQNVVVGSDTNFGSQS